MCVLHRQGRLRRPRHEPDGQGTDQLSQNRRHRTTEGRNNHQVARRNKPLKLSESIGTKIGLARSL